MSRIPNNWRLKKVGDFMVEVKDKIDPTCSEPMNYIGLEHIQSHGRLIGRGESANVRSTKTRFKANDVLYGKLRPYLNKHVVVSFDGVCSTDILVYRNSNIVAAKYFNYWLDLDSNIKGINAEAKGINLPRVSASTINSLEIPVPPEDQLHSIVAKLDTLFGHLDQLKARLQNLPILLKQFRQAVLTQAVTGKLTEEWRALNKAEDVNKMIFTLNPRADYQSSAIDNWINVRLQFITERVSVGHVGPTSQYYTDEANGIPFLRSQNVRPGRIDLKNIEFIKKEFHQKLKKSQLKPGDLLIVRVGANRGDSAILPNNLGEVNCANIVLARPLENLSEYLGIFFTSPQWTNKVDELTTGTAQGVINTSIVAMTEVPLPSFREQKQIVCRVESLFAVADRIEAGYKALQEKIDHLPQAILSKAFNGELITESENESVSILSETIHLERAVGILKA